MSLYAQLLIVECSKYPKHAPRFQKNGLGNGTSVKPEHFFQVLRLQLFATHKLEVLRNRNLQLQPGGSDETHH